MGLPMRDIHSPTVAAGPTAAELSRDQVPDATLPELFKRKEDLEAELSALGSVLDSHGVNMNTTLTTFDGFPRADIDVAQIRTTRSRIIYLRNDYKDLMKRIEKGLEAHFAAASAANNSSPTSDPQQTSTPPSQVPTQATSQSLIPFAKVNSVVPGSPAASASLQAGDKVVSFGEANWLNHDKLSKVAQIVSTNEGRVINVVVLRGGGEQQHTLLLTPERNWGGRGLLGCHLVPL